MISETWEILLPSWLFEKPRYFQCASSIFAKRTLIESIGFLRTWHAAIHSLLRNYSENIFAVAPYRFLAITQLPRVPPSRIRMPSSRRPAITLSICRLLIPKPAAILCALIFGLPATRRSTRSAVVTASLLALPTSLPTLPTSLPTDSYSRGKRIVDRSGFTCSLSTGTP